VPYSGGAESVIIPESGGRVFPGRWPGSAAGPSGRWGIERNMSSAGNVIPLHEAAPGGTVTIRLPGPFKMRAQRGSVLVL